MFSCFEGVFFASAETHCWNCSIFGDVFKCVINYVFVCVMCVRFRHTCSKHWKHYMFFYVLYDAVMTTLKMLLFIYMFVIIVCACIMTYVCMYMNFCSASIVFFNVHKYMQMHGCIDVTYACMYVHVHDAWGAMHVCVCVFSWCMSVRIYVYTMIQLRNCKLRCSVHVSCLVLSCLVLSCLSCVCLPACLSVCLSVWSVWIGIHTI